MRFSLYLLFQMCKTQWDLVSYAVWSSERSPLLVQHVLEDQASPTQSTQGRWQQLWLGRAGADRTLTLLPPQLPREFCTLGTALCRLSLLLHIYYKFVTFLEPVSYSDRWFYHYSSIKRSKAICSNEKVHEKVQSGFLTCGVTIYLHGEY